MTILWGDTGKVVVGTLKSFTFNYPTPYENLLTTPSTVPNVASIPGSPIISYTLTSTNIATISPTSMSFSSTLVVIIGGKNTDSSARTLNYQINRNGSSIISGTFSVSASQFYTVNCPVIVSNLASGDVIDVYVWCSASALLNFDYLGVYSTLTRYSLTKPKIIQNLNYSLQTYPTLSSGTPTSSTSGSLYLYASGVGDNYTLNATSRTFPAYGLDSGGNYGNYWFGRLQYGDASQSGVGYSDATYRPKYFKNWSPTQITYREVLR